MVKYHSVDLKYLQIGPNYVKVHHTENLILKAKCFGGTAVFAMS